MAGWHLSGGCKAANVVAMVWGVQRKHRRIAAALALLGVAFYALLLPGHLTSQFNAQLYKAIRPVVRLRRGYGRKQKPEPVV